MSKNLYPYVPVIFTIVVFIVMLYFVTKKIITAKREREQVQAMINLISSDNQGELDVTKGRSKKDLNHGLHKFERKLKQGGIFPEEMPTTRFRLAIFLPMIVFYSLLSIIFKNLGIGIIPVIVYPIILSMRADRRIKKKERLFNEQIPPFLATFKSNIEAGNTQETALINAIDNTSDPLRSELEIAKSFAATGSFLGGIKELRERTTNQTLGFLCACIELSFQSGTNLTSQLEKIEEILNVRRKLEGQLSKAVAENQPLLIVSAVLIPGLFLFMYFANKQIRDFWFHSLISWIIFFVIFGVYGLAVYFTNKMIKKTGEF